MNDVPLIQKADINSINTSIIAIKKQLKQLTEAVGLIDVPDVDTSVFVKKTDVADIVEADNMSPVTSNAVAEYTVDEVTSGNMHSVSSNAVARAIKPTYYQSTTGAVSVSGANVIRKITNLPSGLYYVTYGFGYVEARAGYQQFYTSDANGTTSTSVMQLRGGWENVEVSCIVSMPNGGEIGFKGYNSSSNFAEQSNGKGITAIRLGDV